MYCCHQYYFLRNYSHIYSFILSTTGRDNEVIDLGIQADVAIGVLKLVYTETNSKQVVMCLI